MTPPTPDGRLPNRGLHLLLDRRGIERLDNALLRPAPCRKHPGNPLTLDGGPVWCHDNLSVNVRWFPEDNCFRALGRCGPAASEDGFTWRREPGGEKVLALRDDPDPNPKRKLKKAIHIEGIQGRPLMSAQRVRECYQMQVPPVSGIGLGWSADGGEWEYLHPVLPARRAFCNILTNEWGGGDGCNHLIYSPELRKYVCYVRTNIDRAMFGYGGRKERAIGRLESEDLSQWSEHEVCLRPNTDLRHALGEPKFDYYHMPVFRYAGIYLSFLSVFYWHSDTVHIELAWSPDTRHWEHLCRGTDLIPQGERPSTAEGGGKLGSGDIDAGCNFGPWEPILAGDQMRVYYGGSPGLHNRDGGRESGLCLAVFGRDRFAGYQPLDSASPGVVTTRPVDVDGRSLQVNADATGGELRVELQQPGGEAIRGFGRDECDPVTADVINATVTWKGRRDLSQWLDRPVRIVFHMAKAKVYGYTFRGGG